MKILKKDGRLVSLDIGQIRKQNIPATKGLNILPEELEINAKISFKDGMTTVDIQNIFIQTALNSVEVDKPDGEYVAGRLSLYAMYHDVKRLYFKKKVNGCAYENITFDKYIEFNKDNLSYATDNSIFDFKELNKSIKSENDLKFKYLAVKTLSERYLIKVDGKITELPQHMLMSISCFLAQKEKDPMFWAVKFYNILTNLKFFPGTPTVSNGRTKNGNCFSCAVGSAPDDLIGIFDSYKTIAVGSKYGTGWGFDWTKSRANGGVIQNVKGAAHGPIPFIKIINDISIAVDQLSVRLGAINVSMESWHKDIIDFINLKKNGGEDKRIAKELFISISCSDLFMERVISNSDFTLFDPYDVKDLPDIYGDEFKERYLSYEQGFINGTMDFTNEPEIINAKTLWKKIQNMAYEVGFPFITFKDTANRNFFDKHDIVESLLNDLGIIRSGNLCQEYLSPIKDDEVTVCNLGSINLAAVENEKDLRNTIYIAMRMLDNVTDVTTYKIPNSEKTQKIRRSVGLGICGEGEVIANAKMMYGSEEHLTWVNKTYAFIAKHRDEASIELGKEKGACIYSKKGYRNLHRGAIAPTSSISILMGTTAAHEAVFDKAWTEENKLGNFKVIAPGLNIDNYQYYVSQYDVNQIDAVKITAARQKYFDMGQSHVFYFRPETTTGKMVFDAYIEAWKSGVITVYYIRTESLKENSVRDRESEITCFGCGG